MKKYLIIIALIMCASANLNAQTELIYNGGVYQNNIKLLPKEVKELFKDDSVALSKYKSGRIFYITGKCIFYPSAIYTGLSLCGLFIVIPDRMGMTILAVNTAIGGAGMLIGYLIYNSGTNKMKNAVNIYNTNINNNKVSVNLGLTENGIGMNIRF